MIKIKNKRIKGFLKKKKKWKVDKKQKGWKILNEKKKKKNSFN